MRYIHMHAIPRQVHPGADAVSLFQVLKSAQLEQTTL